MWSIAPVASALGVLAFAHVAQAADASPAEPRGRPGEMPVSLDDALRAARRAAPEVVVARATELVARAEVGVAGVYPNPTIAGATSTEAARASGTLSVPLIILGQRSAAIEAARADEATVILDTQVAWNDVRQATERAYATLWLAQGVAEARSDSAAIQATLEASVVERVEVGSAPELDALRVHAERLRSDADVLEATAQVTAASSDLARWMGTGEGGALRAGGPPVASEAAPSLAALLARVDHNVRIRREQSDVRAAEARAHRERALVRPAMALDVGFDALDPALSNVTNYRVGLTVDLPLFNQHGAFVERELALGDVASARARAARMLAGAELTSAYRTFEVATARQHTLTGGVLPAAQAAARGAEDAYRLGRAPLVTVLDAERALIDTRLSALQAEAARATAWADVEHAVGAP